MRVALGWVNSDSTFREQVGQPSTGNPLIRQGQTSDIAWLVGGYVAGIFSYSLNQAWRVFVGAPFEHLGNYCQQVPDKVVEMNLKKGSFVFVGLGYSF